MHYAPAPKPQGSTDHYLRSGYQSEISLTALMRRNVAEFGSRTAAIEGDTTLSWRQLVDAAARFAGFLHAKGLRPGDVVVWQLPNWWESLVVAYGIWALGGVSSPVVPIYREHELTNVIGAVHPACVVGPVSFYGLDTVEMLSAACSAAGVDPEVRVVLRGTAAGWTSFDETQRASPLLAERVDVDAPALVGWTSGTTSGAKGVAHSTRSFLSNAIAPGRLRGSSWADRSYMPAPIAHATGLLSAIATPLYNGSSTVLSDRWDAERAVQDIRTHMVTTSSGAAVFMRELIDVLNASNDSALPLSSGYPCGGSAIPTELAEACDDAGMLPARSWGMTECPAVTGSAPTLHDRRIRTATDGLVMPGSELRIVDHTGTNLPMGEMGEAWVRGPQRCLGYLRPEETSDAFDDDGWFRTGDLGRLGEDGSFVVTGRLKDIINRGGEKLSSREIEDVIAGHPSVLDVAVVPVLHERLGEQPAAFVSCRHTLEQEVLTTFLKDAGLAPQKIPKVWRFVDDLPRTASGKVRKNSLIDAYERESSSQSPG